MRPATTYPLGAVAWALAFVAGPNPTAAQEYDVNTGAERRVRFVSTTQVNEFEGLTDHIDGYVVLAEEPLAAGTRTEGSKIYFEVDLASIDTGINLRNRHMRDDYLEVGKYPYATFSGAIANVGTGEGGALRVTAAGSLTVHGVSKGMSLPCDVSPVAPGYRARCSFDVLLSDFDISIPKLMFLKLANEIHLDVAFSVVPAAGAQGGTQ